MWGIPDISFWPVVTMIRLQKLLEIQLCPFRNKGYGRGKGTCAQNAPLGLHCFQPSTFLFLNSCGALSIHFTLSAAFPTGSQPWWFSHPCPSAPFEHWAFFTNTSFLPSLLLSVAFCLSLACLPLPGHLPRELFWWVLYCIPQHLSSWQTCTTPSPILCFSFPPTH